MPERKTSKLEAEPSRRDGKMVDEWTFKAAKPAEKGNSGITVAVKVNLVSDEGRLFFRARIPELGAVEDSDIQKLRERVEQVVHKFSVERLGNVWQDWLRVTVMDEGSSRGPGDFSSGLQVKVEPVKHGVDPTTGKAYILSDHGMWAMPMDSKHVMGEHGDGRFEAERVNGISLSENKTVAFVPATPENLQALNDLSERMNALRDRLMDVLSHQQITQTLVKLNEAILALPSPADNLDAQEGNGRRLRP